MSDISHTFQCKKCGPTVLVLPDSHTDDSIAICKTCGKRLGRWGHIKGQAMKAARKKVRSDFRRMLKNSVKGIKGVTLK